MGINGSQACGQAVFVDPVLHLDKGGGVSSERKACSGGKAVDYVLIGFFQGCKKVAVSAEENLGLSRNGKAGTTAGGGHGVHAE